MKNTDSPGRAYVLVLNWNNWKDTVECLESLFASDYPDYFVVALDNGSTDGSEEKIRQWAEGRLRAESGFALYNPSNKPMPYIMYDRKTAESGGLREKEETLYPRLPSGIPHPMALVQTGADLGYAGGNNIGLRFAIARGDAEFVWIINNDTVVRPDSLSELVSCALADKEAGIAGSKLLYYSNPETIQLAGGASLSALTGNPVKIGADMKDDGGWDVSSRPDFVCGASMLIKADALGAIGLMEDGYFLLWEDAEYCVRAVKKGFKTLYCPQSVLWHREGGTTGRINPTMDYYFVRNGLAFTLRHYPYFLPTVFLSYAFKYLALRPLRGLPSNAGAFFRGVRDFLAGKKGEPQK